MVGSKAITLGLVGLLAALLLAVGLFGGYAGALVVDIEENGPMVPPELEAVYRQVSLESGVSWAALAAWDGVDNRFLLPIPTVEEIFQSKIHGRVDHLREELEHWCKDHPDDKTRCPGTAPELSPDEQVKLWEAATASWLSMRREHVRGHAAWLQPLLSEIDTNPETAFQHFFSTVDAIRAAELFEGYQLFGSFDVDQDEEWREGPELPPGWVPTGGFAWPAVGPITSRYGVRTSPIDGIRRLHAGMDLAVVVGTPVRASKAGTVVEARWDEVFGRVVVVDHQDGYESLYAHNSEFEVKEGQKVKRGEILALSGTSGQSTGPHVHLEIHYHGTPVDPLLVLTQSP